ncbi:phage terminase small subunit P27 family [Leifsonia sp. WHRI 6310E]|uniref:phage terminase small subunit P27 family n=1 Tax=Leifsonia sp. WHRI 6310E TaxID=3162562 RepID=UPI0032EBF759
MGSRGPVSEKKLPPKLRLVSDKTPDTTSANAQVRPTAPERPEDLPENLHDMWDLMVRELDHAGLIAVIDGPALELALRHYAAATQASDYLRAEGVVTYDDKNERMMKNPASQVFRDHSTAYLEFAKQLGLSFTARARTVATKEADDASRNPFAANS